MLGVVHAVATDPATVWMPALGHETGRGSDETTMILLGRVLRLIARHQPRAAGHPEGISKEVPRAADEPT